MLARTGAYSFGLIQVDTIFSEPAGHCNATNGNLLHAVTLFIACGRLAQPCGFGLEAE
jgi:hypothetical protein